MIVQEFLGLPNWLDIKNITTMISYHFYPTLLNQYAKYAKEPTAQNRQVLLNKINRIPETDPVILAKFKKGISFEDAVIKNKISLDFNENLVKEARNHLPLKFKSQVFIEFYHKNIRFYGYADIVGKNEVIDLKSTSNYKEGNHLENFQNLYLYALKNQGFDTMKYVICDFEKIHLESYSLDTYDFKKKLAEMEDFSQFIEKYLEFIKDPKIRKVEDKGLQLF